MKAWTLLEKTTAPDGNVLSLYAHDGEYVLRVRGRELMSNRRTASEIRLAQVGCQGLSGREGAQVLIGGLGLGFTLRSALASLAADATVVVAELLADVVTWNRNPAYPLAAAELADERTEVVVGDVFDVIRADAGRYDAILLDADNGTTAMMTEGNRQLYESRGIASVRAALRPGGTVVYWSASPDPRFEHLMRKGGFAVHTETVGAYGRSDKGAQHHLLIGQNRLS